MADSGATNISFFPVSNEGAIQYLLHNDSTVTLCITWKLKVPWSPIVLEHYRPSVFLPHYNLHVGVEFTIKNSFPLDWLPHTEQVAEAKESKQNLSQYTPLDEEENQTIDRTHKVEGARVFFYQGERECDANMKVFFDCIDAVQGGKEPKRR